MEKIDTKTFFPDISQHLDIGEYINTIHPLTPQISTSNKLKNEVALIEEAQINVSEMKGTFVNVEEDAKMSNVADLELPNIEEVLSSHCCFATSIVMPNLSDMDLEESFSSLEELCSSFANFENDGCLPLQNSCGTNKSSNEMNFLHMDVEELFTSLENICSSIMNIIQNEIEADGSSVFLELTNPSLHQACDEVMQVDGEIRTGNPEHNICAEDKLPTSSVNTALIVKKKRRGKGMLKWLGKNFSKRGVLKNLQLK